MQSQLSPVVALLSICSLPWEHALLLITFSENVGFGFYCHRAPSGFGIFFADTPRYLLPVSQLLLLQQAQGTGFNRRPAPKAPWPRTQAGGSDAQAGLSQEQPVPPPGHGTHQSLARGVGPAAGLHGTQAPLWHGGRSWERAKLQQSCPVRFCAIHRSDGDPSQLRPCPQWERSH